MSKDDDYLSTAYYATKFGKEKEKERIIFQALNFLIKLVIKTNIKFDQKSNLL